MKRGKERSGYGGIASGFRGARDVTRAEFVARARDGTPLIALRLI